MAWSSSDRRSTLPKDWATRRARIKRRAQGQCEWRDSNGTRCTEPGTECHHIGAPTDHRAEMLMWICAPHHKRETQAQAQASRRKMYTDAKKRQPEAHPGIRPQHTTPGGTPLPPS